MLKQYPRPQFARSQWKSLNGEWSFSFDDGNIGLKEMWYRGKPLPDKINVPYVFESERSGIGKHDPHKYVWYARKLDVPQEWKGKRIFLHFGAVDYRTHIYVNGALAGTHTGGSTAFAVEITDYLNYADDTVYVRAEDDPCDEFQARGKQFWEPVPRVIWYTRSTGIWQSVSLECTEERYLSGYQVFPDIDNGTAHFTVRADEAVPGLSLEIDISLRGKPVRHACVDADNGVFDVTLDIFGRKIMASSVHEAGLCWSPENPVLFDVVFTLRGGDRVFDRVSSYFGMRKICAQGGEIWLNNHKYMMRLVLDQGYFKGGLLTPGSEEELERDILLAKRMGFNGCRKHQKVECEYFHYLADKLGFLVWGETANCANYDEASLAEFAAEWAASVRQRRNHPSVVAWVPLNESWGVPDLRCSAQQRHWVSALYHLTKSLDAARPVISNDGWEMAETDIIGIHNYAHGGEKQLSQHARYAKELSSREALLYCPPTNRPIFTEGYGDQGQPILLTEMGGASLGEYEGERYGYSDLNTAPALLTFLQRVFGAVYASDEIKGFCYTQFADVEQEINGLVTEDRTPKVSPEEIAKIVRGEFIR